MSRIPKFLQTMRDQNGLSPTRILLFVYHLPSLARLSVRLLRDRRVPKRLKFYCGLAALYLIVPFDIVPDMLLPLFGLGVADDLTLLFLAFYKLIKDSPADVVNEHVRAIARNGKNEKNGSG